MANCAARRPLLLGVCSYYGTRGHFRVWRPEEQPLRSGRALCLLRRRLRAAGCVLPYTAKHLPVHLLSNTYNNHKSTFQPCCWPLCEALQALQGCTLDHLLGESSYQSFAVRSSGCGGAVRALNNDQ